MQLNENAGRIDMQLEQICKKIEKVESETRAIREDGSRVSNLRYKENYSGEGIPYAQYLRNFKWDSMKHSLKRDLNELVTAIQKKMHQKDEEIRKQMEEYSQLKSRIGSMSKKDTNSFTTKDFTDDIYRVDERG
jgi:predicted  nucleic acid-binding Zn-ribbon protein|mmetsp:Transcript_24933/g.33396  ORF Transcript_24933/g.33396 Transcript_24933/m.33396 type:complete len:134 (+) Transcript_24933:242-643(+)